MGNESGIPDDVWQDLLKMRDLGNYCGIYDELEKLKMEDQWNDVLDTLDHSLGYDTVVKSGG